MNYERSEESVGGGFERRKERERAVLLVKKQRKWKWKRKALMQV